ncbi:MAG: flagellar hook-length control protein FliK [Holophagales bacterium]|jgi:hypothetical protein|nr:flagellar hook-length control protein FliK [Holophagales bacterium]
MDSTAPILPANQTTQLLLSTTHSSAECDQVLRLVGQNVSALLIEQGADGAKLELPSGQIITAKGDLPFPEQTQLQLKVLVQDGSIRLQTLEALPPSTASILAPLLQSEADGLIKQLQALKLPETLIPLAKLFNALIPSGEFHLQQAIDTLPNQTQQLLSSLLGLNKNDSALLLRTLIEQFEPMASLLEMNLIVSDEQLNNVYSSIDSTQKLNNPPNAALNDLYGLLLKHLEYNLSNHPETNDVKQIESLLRLIKSELSSDLVPLREKSVQILFVSSDKTNQFEKIAQTLKLLPDEVRSKISNSVLFRPDSDIETTARAISSEVRNNKISLNKADSNIETIAKTISNEVKVSILNSILGKSDSDAENIARIISDVVHSSISNIASERANSDVEAIVRTIFKKIDISTEETATASKENLSVDTSAKPDRQRLIQILENVPVSIRKMIASAVLGSSEAEPKDIVEHFMQKNINLNVKQDVTLKREVALSVLRQIITLLPDNIRNNISNTLLTKDNFDVEAIAETIIEKFHVSKGEKIIFSPKENLSSDTSEKPNPLKFSQALEKIPVPIRRAVASAILGTAEAEPKNIAEFLIQKGINSNIKQDFTPKLETASPALRQIIALIVESKPDANLNQTIKTILNGDKGVLAAVKGLLSFDYENIAVTPSKHYHSANARDAGNHSLLFSSRMNYLLRFEMLNSQTTFSSQDKNSISSWFRSIVDQLIIAKTAKTEMPDIRPIANSYKFADQTSKKPNLHFEHTVSHEITTPGEKTQTWQMWLKGSLKALTDPTVSSKEAVFHALAAKENINYFELPLPWMPGRTLEIWVEADRENSNRDREKTAHRVLLAINFSELGETRIGLESIAKHLNIRFWAEHPQLIERVLPQMENELSALGFDAQISVHNLSVGQDGVIHSIKSIINASGLHAMG